jgi:hypothetical protein
MGTREAFTLWQSISRQARQMQIWDVAAAAAIAADKVLGKRV